MRKIVFWLIMLIMSLPDCIKAYECSNSDRERLQKLANNITYTLEETTINDNIYFNLTFAGVSHELEIFFTNKYLYYNNLYNDYFSEVHIGNLPSGRTYVFNIQSGNVCIFDVVRTITINTPHYNSYYNDQICNNAKEHAYCQKWNDTSNVTYDTFYSKVNEYIKSKKDVVDNDLNDKEDYYIKFLYYYEKYYWYALCSLIIVCGLLAYLWVKENRKNRL